MSSRLITLLAASLLLIACEDDAPSSTADAADSASVDTASEDSVEDTAPEETSEDTTAEETAEDAPGDVEPAPREPRAVYVWQGFHHEWLREVAGFRVPHRVSRLETRVTDVEEAETIFGSQALFGFGQNTGVDGNYMKPVGYYSALRTPHVDVAYASLQMTWTDDLDETDYPQARSTRSETLEVPLSSLGDGEHDQVVALLGGFALNLTCDDAKQPESEPCNSNGMWPFRMAMSVGTCEVAGDVLGCPVEVEMFRAWTPNLGGLPPIEIKPINDKLDFDLTLHLAVIAGTTGTFNVVQGEPIEHAGVAHDKEPHVAARAIRGELGYPLGIAGITAWSFEFLKRAGGDDSENHLGRYIGGLDFHLDAAYEADTGFIDVDHHSWSWVPDTVVNADTAHVTRAVLLQFAGEDTEALDLGASVIGSLCSNSTDQAPEFSVWEECGGVTTGPEQDTDQVVIP